MVDEDRSGDDWVSRVVSAVGVITVSNQVFSVGKHRAGEVVDVHVRAHTACGFEYCHTPVCQADVRHLQ